MQATNKSNFANSIACVTIVVAFSLSACEKASSLLEQGKDAISSTEHNSPAASTPSTETTKDTAQSPQPLTTQKKIPPSQSKQTAPLTKPKPPTKKRKPSLTELPVKNPPTLPIDRVITDSNGRELDVKIVARYENEIAVIRKKDSKTFDLPIEKLSEEDRIFVLKIRSSKKPEKIDPFVVRRQKMIAQYKKDIIRLREEVASGTITTSQMRSKNKEQGRIDLKIENIKRQISDHLQK